MSDNCKHDWCFDNESSDGTSADFQCSCCGAMKTVHKATIDYLDLNLSDMNWCHDTIVNLRSELAAALANSNHCMKILDTIKYISQVNQLTGMLIELDKLQMPPLPSLCMVQDKFGVWVMKLPSGREIHLRDLTADDIKFLNRL